MVDSLVDSSGGHLCEHIVEICTSLNQHRSIIRFAISYGMAAARHAY